MAKNSKGQKVSNKKYYKTKTASKKSSSTKSTVKKSTPKKTSNVKKTTAKKKTVTPKKSNVKKTTVKKTTPKKKVQPKKVVTPKKVEKVVEKNVLENNVSLIVDNKEEKLNYNILEEEVKYTKAKSSRGVKTKFNDDLLEEIESEKQVDDAFSNVEENINREEKEEAIEVISRVEEAKDNSDVVEEEKLEEEIAYNGFIIRLIVLVLILILSIFFVIKFVVKYINNSPLKDVSYFESSDVSYSLCTGDDCNEDTLASTSLDKVKVKFNYNVSFDDSVSLKVTYRVSEKLDITNNGVIVESNSKDVLEKVIKKNKTDTLDITKDVEVALPEYRKALEEYRSKHEGNFNGRVVISLFVDGIQEDKEVANFLVPLSDDRVQTSIISSNVGDSLFKDDTMQNYGNLYIILFVTSLVVVISACIGIVVLINSSDIRGE